MLILIFSMSLLTGISCTIIGQCTQTHITPLVSFTWSEEPQFLAPLVLPLASLQRLCRGAAHNTWCWQPEHSTAFFSGLHSGLWMNLPKMHDLLGFKLLELLFALCCENRWWRYFCWHCVEKIVQFSSENWGMEILFWCHNQNLPNSRKIHSETMNGL